jgi:hypothetical protein
MAYKGMKQQKLELGTRQAASADGTASGPLSTTTMNKKFTGCRDDRPARMMQGSRCSSGFAFTKSDKHTHNKSKREER